MARIGLNNFWYSHLTEAADGTPTFDGAKSLGKAVSANVSISNNSAALYADDVLAESDTSFQNGTITLGTDDDRETTLPTCSDTIFQRRAKLRETLTILLLGYLSRGSSLKWLAT